MNKLTDIEKNIEKDIFDLGFELEYIEFIKENDNDILRIVIDKKDCSPISFDDCEKVSKNIEEKVDKYIDKEYILEISSPGLERKLKNIKLFKKYIGSKIYIKLFKKINILEDVQLKEFDCTIIDVIDSVIKLELEDYNNVVIELKYSDIAKANTLYDFNMKEG